jgi:hypothetical protein
MNAPRPYPCGVDPVHVLAICAEAAPGHHRDTAILVGGQRDARVYLPTRGAARAAQAALRRVGYQVDRPAGSSRGKELVIQGWSAEGLEARLVAMRAVLQQLAADPGSMATKVLEKLCGVPEAELPGRAGQQRLITQAALQLRRWVFAGCGIQVPHDPRLLSADTGCALRVSAAWQLEDATDDLLFRQVRVARHALDLYPALRQQLGHEHGRDTAVQRAGIIFHLRGNPIAQDTSSLLGRASQAPGPAPSAGGPATTRASSTFRPGSRAAREFPFSNAPVTSSSRPSSAGTGRLSGRNFPSGRSGPHP